MAGRRDVRQAAFLLSFEKLFLDEELDSIFESAQELEEFITVDDEVKALVRALFDKQEEIDGIIARYSDKRAVSRIPKVDLAVLRLAIYEALYDEKVPVNVAISEAVGLTEKYALEPDISFVNGVLGSFSKDISGSTPAITERAALFMTARAGNTGPSGDFCPLSRVSAA